MMTNGRELANFRPKSLQLRWMHSILQRRRPGRLLPMTKSSAIADSFARVVFLLRDIPEDKEAQKSAFRALLVRITGLPIRFTVGNGRLLVDGEDVEPETPGTIALRRQLLGHGVGDLSIPAGLNPGQLLTVIRAVAAPVGAYPRLQQLADHFTVSGIDGVAATPPAPTAAVTATEAAPRQTPPQRPAILEPPSSKTEEREIRSLGPDAANEESVGLLHFVTLELKSIGRLDELLIELERNPDFAGAGELLNEVVAFGDTAMQKEQWSELVRVAGALVRLEGKASDESQRRLYGIALRRLISKSTLEQIARILPQSDQRGEATNVLRRVGADATEVLVNLLCAENDVGYRRVYFNAVTQMTEGTELLVHMLGHDEWFVVRNVAELCGEMRLDAAVPALARRLSHTDERVRRAATSALGRIGSPSTMEPLRKALQDTSALVRLQAASVLEGIRARNLVPALTRLVEEESHADVQHEMLHALGRIGTPEAIEALIRASQPAKGFFKKKPLGIRLEAVEGLRLAGGPASVASLQDLEKDKEESVRQAASHALKTVLGTHLPKD
jgi:HEAT repeat protein